MDELKLVFINDVGSNWKGDNVYEFLYSDNIGNVEGEDWDELPANGKPLPPNTDFIKEYCTVETHLKFDVIQHSNTFSVFDAVDGVVSLAWENILDYEIYPEKRLFFRYGEDIKSVQRKLYENDINFQTKEIKI